MVTGLLDFLLSKLHFALVLARPQWSEASSLFQSGATIAIPTPPGHRKTVSDRHKHLVLQAIFDHPFDSWPGVLKHVKGISLSTLKRIASAEGIRHNVALKKPALSKKNIAD